MTPRLALLAAPLAAGAALIPASVARADNADVIRRTEVLVSALASTALDQVTGQ